MNFALLQLVTTASAVEVNSGKDKPLLAGQTGQTPVVSSDDVIVDDVPLHPTNGLPTQPPSGMKSFTYQGKEIDVHDGTIWCDEKGDYSMGVKTYYWYGIQYGQTKMGFSPHAATNKDYWNLMMIESSNPTYRHQCPQLFYEYNTLGAEEKGGFNSASYDGEDKKHVQQVVIWKSTDNMASWKPVDDQGLCTHNVSNDIFEGYKKEKMIENINGKMVFVKEVQIKESRADEIIEGTEGFVDESILEEQEIFKTIPKGSVIVKGPDQWENDAQVTFTVMVRHWPDQGKSGMPGAFVSLIDLTTKEDLSGDIYFRSQMIHVPGDDVEYPFVLWVNHLPRTAVIENAGKDNLLEFYEKAGYLIGKSKTPSGPFEVVRQLDTIQRNDKYVADYGLADFSLFRDKHGTDGYIAYGSWGPVGQDDGCMWDCIACCVFDIPSFLKNCCNGPAKRNAHLPHNAIANAGHVVQIKKLSDDCTNVADDNRNPDVITKNVSGEDQKAREAPAQVYHNGIYWLFSGHTSCFNRRGSDIMLYVSLDLKNWETVTQTFGRKTYEYNINPELLLDQTKCGLTGHYHPANPLQVPGQVNSIVTKYHDDGEVSHILTLDMWGSGVPNQAHWDGSLVWGGINGQYPIMGENRQYWWEIKWHSATCTDHLPKEFCDQWSLANEGKDFVVPDQLPYFTQ